MQRPLGVVVLAAALSFGCGDDDETTRPAVDEKPSAGDSAGRKGDAGAPKDAATRAMKNAWAEDASSAPKLSYWANAKPIIDAKCTTCHLEGGIAPMPLTTYEEIAPFIPLIKHEVESGVMPPWNANAPFGFFEGDRRLTDPQEETLLSWIDEGASEGDSEGEGPSLVERAPREIERVDLSLRSSEPYTPQIEPDDYRCFVLEWPYWTTTYITAIEIAPDARAMVHHAIVYHVLPENVAAARERDAAEEGPGYTCFGATGAVTAWLQSYEPGGYGQGVPGNLGFEVPAGSAMILQVHYNTLNGLSSDQSAVKLTIEDSVPRVGHVMLMLNPTWPAGNMPIPAGEQDVPFAYRGRAVTLEDDVSYGVYWVDLHMHQLGSSGRIGIIRAETEQFDVLLDIPKWDFEWQETYLLHKPDVLAPGDELYVECHFDNTAENQGVVNGERPPPRDVNWGDGTTDEMCLGNVLVAPLP